MTDTDTMERIDEMPALSATDRVVLTQMLDAFLSTGQTRSLVPISEVQNLALDMRRVLNPVMATSEPTG